MGLYNLSRVTVHALLILPNNKCKEASWWCLSVASFYGIPSLILPQNNSHTNANGHTSRSSNRFRGSYDGDSFGGGSGSDAMSNPKVNSKQQHWGRYSIEATFHTSTNSR
jgi:hypothetical protein